MHEFAESVCGDRQLGAFVDATLDFV